MPTAPSLLECQRRFMTTLYAADESGPVDAIAGNGLAPRARLRIYRHSCESIQTGVLRTTYPAVLALVGAAFFEQCAHVYRRVHASRSGNLQAFGSGFADYLETLSALRTLPYLPDVTRLEWLRQQAALAADAQAWPAGECVQALNAIDGSSRMVLHPGIQRLTSLHAVLTIWRYAMQPDDECLQLPDAGENVVLWREDGEVAMAALDAASFACIEALAQGEALAHAGAVACAVDPAFDLAACITSFAERGFFVAPASPDFHDKEPASCR